jgi:hypothetical protein
MINYDIKLAKSTVRFLNNNLNYLNKFIVENFNEKCFIYVNSKKSIFNISITNKITVEVDNNQDRYNSYFYNETYNFQNVNEFKDLFNKIVKRATKDEKHGMNLNYKGKTYPIYIEISHIDTDRGMGVEKLYDLTIYDGKGKEHIVAQVSEYPLGSFNLVHIFEDFEIGETEIINYFYEKY